MTLVDAILDALPISGAARLKAVRCVLRCTSPDLAPAQIDYALQGMQRRGQVVILDGWIRKRLIAADPPRPANVDHPWRRLPFKQATY